MRSLPFRSFTLSEEQQVIVDVVEKGHNVYFGGIAGCGKTFVARHVLNVLSRKGIEFACTLYGHITARTIHSFSGIGHCWGTNKHLLRNVLSNQDCAERWRSSEVLLARGGGGGGGGGGGTPIYGLYTCTVFSQLDAGPRLNAGLE